MTAPKSRRWVCPRCERYHLAPARLRTIDVRRFCLPCSMETGLLVERTCPSLEAERTAKRVKAATKRASVSKRQRETAAAKRARLEAQAERDRARRDAAERARHDVAGIDLRDELARLWKLPSIVEAYSERGGRMLKPGRAAALPPLEVRRHRQGWKAFTSGHCDYGTRRITMTIGTHEGGALETLLHEVTHAALPWVGHSDTFWALLRRAAREAWPTADFRYHEGPPNERGHQLDERIGRAIHRVLVDDGRVKP